MAGFSQLWENTMLVLKNNVQSISFDTWIRELKPLNQENDVFYFEVASDLHKKMIVDRYISTIKDCLLQTITQSNFPVDVETFDIELLTTKEKSLLNTNPLKADTTPAKSIKLNPSYSFENFVVGSSNKFAHAASVAVAERPGLTYNPLFIYGGVGLGKTHLMQAIANYVKQQYEQANIMYVTSESFMNELISSIQTNRNVEFRNKYRNVDVLLIDDIQFIAGRESTQEEFFHTFNALYETNKQIIISSDKPPQDIPSLEDRLSSRFQWGLLADIQPPDYETRMAILKNKYDNLKAKENFDFNIPEEILSFIAEKSLTNIRQLEGALQKVFAFSRINNAPVDLSTSEKILKDFFKSDVKMIYPKDVIDIICDYYNITEEDIKGRNRAREISFPRQIAMYIMRDVTDYSLPKIGSIFGGRDHTTVMHACEKISNDMQKNTEFKITVSDLINKVKNN
ncbi:MAG: chromosomal replication initiator protein DnaA [Eubacteriales bacterium]